MEKELDIGILNDIYGALLTPNQREMVSNYYDADLSLGEIAENYGISRQAVRDSILKGCAALKRYEDALKIREKLSGLKRQLECCLLQTKEPSVKAKLRQVIDDI